MSGLFGRISGSESTIRPRPQALKHANIKYRSPDVAVRCRRGRTQAIGGGITLEFLAGGTGIVLGILSLYSHVTQLAPAALIVFGGTLLLGGGVAAPDRIARQRNRRRGFLWRGAAAMIVRQSATAAAGAQVLIGVATVVLGILALAGAHAQTLNLVGLLAVGAGLLMTGVTSASAAVVNQAAP